MIRLDLDDNQAKFLLILLGNCAGSLSTYGLYHELYEKLDVFGLVPDLRFTPRGSVIIDQEMIDEVKTN